MKETDLEKLKPGDEVVFVKTSSSTNALFPYKKGDVLIFERFDYTIDTFYFLRADESVVPFTGYKMYTLCTFSSKIHKFIQLRSDYIKNSRNSKIDKILPVWRKKKLNG